MVHTGSGKIVERETKGRQGGGKIRKVSFANYGK